MHALIEHQLLEHSAELRETCRRHRVRRLDLFGSAATGLFDPASSDMDLLVGFEEDYFPGIADTYLELAEHLEKLFGRHIDLLTERSIRNPYLRESISQTRVPLYEA